MNTSKRYLAIDEGGAGDPPFILIHSLGGEAAFWRDVVAALQATHHAVAYDLRGHGCSMADPEGRFSLEDHADDVLQVADAMRLHRFVLVGHSFGALVALAVAARSPARVVALALVDAGGAMTDVPASALEEFLAGVASPGGAAFVRQAYEANLERAAAATREQVLASLARTDPRALLAGYTSLFGTDPHALLARYPGPVRLVVDAANDSPMALHAQQRELDVVAVEGTSHWINLDQPGALAAALKGVVTTATGNR